MDERTDILACTDIITGNMMYIILSQSSNATLKGQEFYTTNCCRAVYVGKNAQLILKNLYCKEN